MKTAVVLLTLILAIATFAEVINVPDDFETIQGAIDASEDGDTVLVQPGEYVENINFDGKAIAVIGNPDDPSEVIIDGDANDHSVVVFRNEEGRNTVLSGFTIQNGTTDYGGGIYCNGAGPTLQYLFITNNVTLRNGGGIYCTQGASPIITDVHIFENIASSGGGLTCNDGADVTVLNTSISRNRARDDAGGVQLSNSQLTMRNIVIDNNSVSDVGGGFTFFEQSTLVIDRGTIIGNEHGGIYKVGNGGLIKLTNTIFRDNGENFTGLNVRDTIMYCNVNGRISGEGNIDEDPVFVDFRDADYHLTHESPCIDAGDPESPSDSDSTRADIGAYPFKQIGAIVEGYILDAEDDQPLANVCLINEFEQDAIADSIGFWSIRILPGRQHTITAQGIDGYQDSTVIIDELELDDTLEVIFRLLHSELAISQENFRADLEVGDSASFDFNIRNDGNGILEWFTISEMQDTLEPWQLRESLPVGNTLNDGRIRGVVFVDDHYYVAGGGSSSYDDNFIYVLNHDGELLDSYHQLGQARYGMGDLAWDGELIWGCTNERIYGFNVDGRGVTAFAGPYPDNQAIAWDCDRELLWIAGSETEYIIGYNRDGAVIDSVSQFGLITTGLAYYPNDIDGYHLYVTHRIIVPRESDSQALHKVNLDENDTLFVSKQYTDGIEPFGRSRGIFITDQLDPISWVMLSIADWGADDRLDIWHVAGNGSWMRIEPESGTIDPNEQTDITLTLDATDLAPMAYPGELRFRHNGFGGETIIPIDLTVSPSGVFGDDGEELPAKFNITGVYPNPFNASTTISYTLPQSQKIEVQLYDLSGRLVETLHDDFQTAGNHSVVWASGDFGSGIYMVRIKTETETKIAKLVAIK